MSKCKLIVFSDIHYLDISVDEKEIHKKRKLTQYAEILTDRLIRKINEEEPDVSICLGDLIQDVANHERDIENFTYIWNKLKNIKVPFYGVLGNHDLKSMDSRKEIEQIMGYENATFSVNIKGYHFVILSTNIREDNGEKDGGIHKAQCIAEEEINWLKNDLAQNSLPCIIFTHFGLAEDRQIGNYWFEKNPEKGLISNRNEVKEIIKQDSNVIAIFSGHQHWTKQIVEDGKSYYLIGSLVENINMDGVPAGVYLEVELENRNIQISERHIKL